MEAPPVTVMPVTGGTINMMEYLLQGKTHAHSIDEEKGMFEVGYPMQEK